MQHCVEIELGGRKLSIETGVMAKQADGGVVVRYGDTIILATAVASSKTRPDIDFLPLTVEFREKLYAAGRVPGSFFKREGRPGEREILVSRLIDRPLRPLFPKGITNELQILCSTLSYDPDCDADILAIIGSSAAVTISSIPFAGPVGAVKLGKIGNAIIINPNKEEQLKSELSIVMAATKDSIVMVEANAAELSEDDMIEALIVGHEEIKKIVDLQSQLAELAGKEKFSIAVTEKVLSQDVINIKNEYSEKIKEAVLTHKKIERGNNLVALRNKIVEECSVEEDKIDEIKSVFEEIERETIRASILNNDTRGDGRTSKDIRPISIKPSLLPRTHGSVLFTRGETQALVVATLGTAIDAQRLDNLDGRSEKKFMLHYNFPPFCVGEVKFMTGTGRREIGHGALAERAIKVVLPEQVDFPYTIRIVSEILESNGSSSMASVCGASLALMDSGVPIKSSVAGIAMGLVMEADKTVILSDITGQEDHLGDMDFKVAGTKKGITALQMDIKISGVTKELMGAALRQAKEGRLHILNLMDETLPVHKSELSEYAPRITKIQVDKDKVKSVIGPGGKTIKGIIEETKVSIDIEDDGTILIASNDQDAARRAIEIIQGLTQDPEIGKIYKGTVKKIMDFGAFVEILPGTDGLVHISQLAEHRVIKVTDEVSEGDVISVKVLEVDRQGKIRLSRKEAIKEENTK